MRNLISTTIICCFIVSSVLGQNLDDLAPRIQAVYANNSISDVEKGGDLLEIIGLADLPSTRINEAKINLIPVYIQAKSLLGQNLEVVVAARFLYENDAWPADSAETGLLMKNVAQKAANLRFFVDALRFYDKLDQYLPSLSRNTQLRVRLDRAWFSFRMLDYSNGIKYASEVEAVTRNLEDEMLHGRAMSAIAYAEAMFINHVEIVDSLALGSLKIAKKYDDLCGQELAYLALATYHSYTNTDAGIIYADKLIKIARQLNDSQQEQNGLAYRGRAYVFSNEFDLAVKDFEASDRAWNLDIIKNSADSRDIVKLSPRMYLANVKTVVFGIKRMQSNYWMIWVIGILSLVSMLVIGYFIRWWQDGRRESDLSFNRANIDRLRNKHAKPVIDYEDEEGLV